jgi:hypothetical protein
LPRIILLHCLDSNYFPIKTPDALVSNNSDLLDERSVTGSDF